MSADDKLFMLLGEMKSDLKSLTAKADSFLSEVRRIDNDVNELKEWRDGIMGKITVILVVAGAVWSMFVMWLTKKLF